MNRNKKMIDISRVMREEITIQKKVNSEPIQDNFEFKDYININAEVNLYKSKLVNEAKAENTKRYIVVRIRYRKDLDESMRILYNNIPYNIESILPLSRENLYLEILAYTYINDNFGAEYDGLEDYR